MWQTDSPTSTHLARTINQIRRHSPTLTSDCCSFSNLTKLACALSLALLSAAACFSLLLAGASSRAFFNFHISSHNYARPAKRKQMRATNQVPVEKTWRKCGSIRATEQEQAKRRPGRHSQTSENTSKQTDNQLHFPETKLSQYGFSGMHSHLERSESQLFNFNRLGSCKPRVKSAHNNALQASAPKLVSISFSSLTIFRRRASPSGKKSASGVTTRTCT